MEIENDNEFVDQGTLPFDPPLKENSSTQPSETEALRLHVKDLTRSLMLAEARNELTSMLRSAGARSPDLLFEAAGKLLQFGDDGSLQNAEAVSAELERKFPEQFGSRVHQPTIDAGAGSAASHQVLTRENLARMKPSEVARLDWNEVRQVLAS